MAWERNFEAKVLKIRAKELKYQRLNYTIEVRHFCSGFCCFADIPCVEQTLWNAIWFVKIASLTITTYETMW